MHLRFNVQKGYTLWEPKTDPTVITQFHNRLKTHTHTHTHTNKTILGDMQPGPSLGFATFGSSRLFII